MQYETRGHNLMCSIRTTLMGCNCIVSDKAYREPSTLVVGTVPTNLFSGLSQPTNVVRLRQGYNAH